MAGDYAVTGSLVLVSLVAGEPTRARQLGTGRHNADVNGKEGTVRAGGDVIGPVGAWIAQVAFWVLLLLGVGHGALSRKSVAIFVALWLVGYAGLPRLSALSGMFNTPYVAVLDIVLVFVVLKGDVRLT